MRSPKVQPFCWECACCSQVRPVAGTTELTGLCRAVVTGPVRALRQLIANGADVNEANQAGGDTPLHTAITISSSECVTVLLRAGANPYAGTKHQVYSALQHAVCYTPDDQGRVGGLRTKRAVRAMGVLEMLLKRGLDPNAHNVPRFDRYNQPWAQHAVCFNTTEHPLLTAVLRNRPGAVVRLCMFGARMDGHLRLPERYMFRPSACKMEECLSQSPFATAVNENMPHLGASALAHGVCSSDPTDHKPPASSARGHQAQMVRCAARRFFLRLRRAHTHGALTRCHCVLCVYQRLGTDGLYALEPDTGGPYRTRSTKETVQFVRVARKPWAPSRHTTFSSLFRRMIRTTLLVAQRTDTHWLPPELWLHVCSFATRSSYCSAGRGRWSLHGCDPALSLYYVAD